jgi:hypothetical protein
MKMMLKTSQGREMKLKNNTESCKNLKNLFVRKIHVKIHSLLVINRYKVSKKINLAQFPKISSETNPKNSQHYNLLQLYNLQNSNKLVKLSSNHLTVIIVQVKTYSDVARKSQWKYSQVVHIIFQEKGNNKCRMATSCLIKVGNISKIIH